MEFEDEDECENHEMQLIEDALLFYKHDFEEGTLENCSYVNLVTKKDVAAMIKLCSYTGVSCKGIDKTGIYLYNDRGNHWIDLTEVCNRINGGARE